MANHLVNKEIGKSSFYSYIQFALISLRTNLFRLGFSNFTKQQKENFKKERYFGGGYIWWIYLVINKAFQRIKKSKFSLCFELTTPYSQYQ